MGRERVWAWEFLSFSFFLIVLADLVWLHNFDKNIHQGHETFSDHSTIQFFIFKKSLISSSSSYLLLSEAVLNFSLR